MCRKRPQQHQDKQYEKTTLAPTFIYDLAIAVSFGCFFLYYGAIFGSCPFAGIICLLSRYQSLLED
jgi:hypothetical protein